MVDDKVRTSDSSVYSAVTDDCCELRKTILALLACIRGGGLVSKRDGVMHAGGEVAKSYRKLIGAWPS